MDIRTAFILTLVSLSLTGEGRKTEKNNCVRLPELEQDILKVGNFWAFHPTTASLDVNLSSVVQFTACNSNSSSSEVDKKGHHQQLVRVDLVSTTEQSALPRSIRLRLLHRSDQLRPHRGFAASQNQGHAR